MTDLPPSLLDDPEAAGWAICPDPADTGNRDRITDVFQSIAEDVRRLGSVKAVIEESERKFQALQRRRRNPH